MESGASKKEKGRERVAKVRRLCSRRWGTEPRLADIIAIAFVGASRGGWWLETSRANWRFPIRRSPTILDKLKNEGLGKRGSAKSTFLRYNRKHGSVCRELLQFSLFGMLHAEQGTQTARTSWKFARRGDGMDRNGHQGNC